jgi:aminopeptidase N
MIHTLIGEDAFRRGLDLYFDRHDGGAVTCEDFVAAMATASGRDFAQFFRWYEQAGTPRLEVEGAYDPETRRYALSLRQHTPPTPGQPTKAPFKIPVRLGLLDASGAELPLRLEGENAPVGTERVLELSAPEQRFVFEGVPGPPVPSLLRGFSAPVRLEAPFTDAELGHLLAHDTDGFARWDAGQTLALRTLLGLVDDHAAGRRPELPDGFVAAWAKVLADDGIEPAFKAQLMGLPSATYLGEQMAVIDVEGIAAAREAAQAALGRRLAGELRELAAACREEGFALTAEAMGKRRLKNTALGYLAHGVPEEVRAGICAQAREATNMTDRLAALALVARWEWPERGEVLDRFYRDFEDEPLVVNKWFAVQAMAERTGVVEEVEGLLQHPAFTLANPNRVRSVLGVFAGFNPRGFHRRDGAGYRLIGDLARELDARNPAVAARLAKAFDRWRRFDPARQRLMREQLERLAGAQGLSRDVYEIVHKSLEAAGEQG